MIIKDTGTLGSLEFVFIFLMWNACRLNILLAHNGLVYAYIELRDHILVMNILLSLFKRRFLITFRCRVQQTTISAWSGNTLLV